MAAKSKISGDVLAVVSLAGMLVVMGELVGDSTLGMLLTPVVFLLLVYAMCRSPVRHSMMALMFLALTLPNPGDTTPTPKWKAPFQTVGAIMLTHLNAVDRSIGWLSSASFSGMDLCLVTLIFITLYRKSSGSRTDRLERVPTPQPLVRLAFIALGGAAYVWVSGMVRGGDFRFSLWQLNTVMYLPTVFLLFHVGLRGPSDSLPLAKVVMYAALYRALVAIYVTMTITGPMDPETGSTRLAYATAHADSMLFADAFVLIVICLLERLGKRTIWIALVALPILTEGMIFNNRRLVWVQVALVLITVYVVAKDNPVKKLIRRSLYVLSPLLTGYIMAGWNSGGGTTFKPVRMLRSVVDAKSNGSSFWRELENFNLLSTIKSNPIFGTGYGHGYDVVVVLPAIDYDLEPYCPHNSLLGLWAYCGYFGYAALTMLWVIGVYFAMRAYYSAKSPSHRAAALVSFGAILVYIVQCWGDLGLGTWTGVFTVGPALAMAGKLSVVTGEWSTGKRKAAPQVFQGEPA